MLRYAIIIKVYHNTILVKYNIYNNKLTNVEFNLLTAMTLLTKLIYL